MEVYELIEKEEKKFSFVVPVYKTEKYLENCLKSILDQDYKNIEIVVVADGESKKAKKLFDKLQKNDKRLVKYVTIPHGGAPKARNEGYKHISGDYVSFWDSDCYAMRGMVRMWYKIFLLNETIQFVYSGYRTTSDNETFMSSEEFDPFTLTCYNYIPTMGCMKKEIFPGFDETLESLQDWDLWLTITEKGYKGKLIEGVGFITEVRSDGISAKNCNPDVWLDRYNKVRNKHHITGRDIAYTSTDYQFRAKELARYFNQDFRDSSQYHHPCEYKMIYCIGFYPQNMQITSLGFKGIPEGCKMIIHWMGPDIDGMMMLPYKVMKDLVTVLNQTIYKYFCENESARKMLSEIGIEASVLPLPMEVKDSIMPDKEFKVYYENDLKTQELMHSVVQSCPDIKFESPEISNLDDYACFLSVTDSIMPSENLKRFVAAGRYVITNYQLPYAGYVETDKEKIVTKIREIYKLWKKKDYTNEGVNFYKSILSMDIFKNTVLGVLNETKN